MYKPAAYRSPSPSPLDNPDRIVSLDALRGFDMFWILGIEGVVEAIGKLNHSPWSATLVDQMTHRKWEGFVFEDLIFPMFVFVVGVSLVFSLGKMLATAEPAVAVKRVVFRAAALILLGIIYNGGVSKVWPNVRLAGVLQRIGLCYLAAGLLFIYCRPRTIAIVTVTLLLGYWALLSWVPVPGVGRGNFERAKNLADYIDMKVLPGRLHEKVHEPEGLLSTLPAIATCLLGIFAGFLLRSQRQPIAKAAILLLSGAIGVVVGRIWGGIFDVLPQVHIPTAMQFPVIKKIWTSSFVLVAGGYSAALLGLFYLIIDVAKFRIWAIPFVWIGMNAITLYLLENLMPFPSIANRLVGGSVAHALGDYADLIRAVTAVLLVLLIARFLYRRQVFLRL
jgi:predicted acyltransferase